MRVPNLLCYKISCSCSVGARMRRQARVKNEVGTPPRRTFRVSKECAVVQVFTKVCRGSDYRHLSCDFLATFLSFHSSILSVTARQGLAQRSQ